MVPLHSSLGDRARLSQKIIRIIQKYLDGLDALEHGIIGLVWSKLPLTPPGHPGWGARVVPGAIPDQRWTGGVGGDNSQVSLP